MRKIISIFMGFALMPILALLGAGCFGQDETPPVDEPQMSDTASVADQINGTDQLAEDTILSNPATVYCLSQGGSFEMQKTLSGTTEGYCKLPHNITCEVWAYYKGDCPEGARVEETEEETPSSTESGVEMYTRTDLLATTTSNVGSDADAPSNSGSDETHATQASSTAVSAANPNGITNGTVITTDEKKKIIGDIDIAVKPGEDSRELILSWDPHELSAPDGYIVMLSGNSNITYPSTYSHKLPREESYSFVWTDLNPEREYYFRVCIADGDSCTTYSPVISGFARSETE